MYVVLRKRALHRVEGFCITEDGCGPRGLKDCPPSFLTSIFVAEMLEGILWYAYWAVVWELGYKVASMVLSAAWDYLVQPPLPQAPPSAVFTRWIIPPWDELAGPGRAVPPEIDLDQPNTAGCIICSREMSLCACSSCGARLYCSRKCQKEDWKVHKILCATWESFKQPPAGRADLRRVIVFEVSQPVVRFAWVPVRRISRWGESYDNPDVSGVLEAREGGKLAGTAMCARNRVRNRWMKVALLNMVFRDSAQRDGSPTNLAVAKHLPPQSVDGKTGLVWKGPLIVLKCHVGPERILNVDFCDLRDAADWLSQWSLGLP